MKHFMLKMISTAAVVLCLCTRIYAVTVDAGDYTRLPDGTNLAVLYLQHTTGSDLYVNSHKVSDNADLDVNLAILRGVHYIDFWKLTVAPQFLLPIGELKSGGDISMLNSKNGIGDLILAPTIHVFKDPERKKAFAITPWLYLPTGAYDRDKDFNALGENRWKLALQAGYITPITDRWTLDLVGDVMFFGDNTDFTSNSLTLKQSPMYEGQVHLRYHLNVSTYISAMVSHSWGGETKIDGVDQNNEQSRTKTLWSIGHFLTPTLQILGSYGTDLSVDEGVEEAHRLNFRLVKVF